MGTRPLLIGLRELKSYLADRGDLLFSLALPVALVALMLAAFGGGAEFHGTGYVVDRDGGPYARSFLDRLRQAPGLEVKLLKPDAARKRLDDSAILVYTEIPPGFSEALAAGRPVELVRHQRGNGGEVGQIVGGYVQEAAQRVGAAVRLRAQVEQVLTGARVSLPPDQVQAEVERTLAQAEESPPVAVVREGGEDEEDLAATLFPKIVSWFVLFALTLNAQSLVHERRQGTLERLLTTRMTGTEFFLGKFLGNFLRGLIQFILLFGLAALVFDFFTVRSFLLSVLFGALVVAAASALSLVIAALVRTQDQAVWVAVFFTMGMAVFGGTFVELDPDSPLGSVGRGTLTYWANDSFHALIREGAGPAGILGSIAVMAGVAVAGLALSRLLFRPLAGRA